MTVKNEFIQLKLKEEVNLASFIEMSGGSYLIAILIVESNSQIRIFTIREGDSISYIFVYFCFVRTIIKYQHCFYRFLSNVVTSGGLEMLVTNLFINVHDLSVLLVRSSLMIVVH